MKNREVVTKDNYKQVVLKRAIILCWVLLGICFVVKIFGGNFFNIVCNNEKFIKVCEYIDNSWLYYLLGFISYNLTNYFLFKCTDTKNKQNKLIKIISIIILQLYWVFKILFDLKIVQISFVVYSILDVSILYICLLLYSKQPLRSLISMGIMLLFSLVSALIKNISIIKVFTDNLVITFIFMIDYYIMFTLYYLYIKKYKRRN